ncbi:PREDICTED: izumo sperm-egg fusion protein 4 isoform X3 [Chinchilla lanigera]|uniref:izumo sperm-egg fusion protein 4 isoform X3 n=2 Tax=Chinchilla lanigera TaxID=34839 RepID=UPI00069608B5|nr:PREDICTED: izumo sperm-egg fusion protein 4 isoform X3 [Chinchilla lanigera]
MALLLCLGMTAALAHGCLHCHNNFSEKFFFYRHHVNLKSWWVGDIPVSGALLADWSQDTMRELHLAIPAEITRENLEQVARTVYRKMDQLYQGKMYFPGYFPNELRAIFREQVQLIQNAIIKSRIDCQRHCASDVLQGSSSMRPYPVTTVLTRTSCALATTASPRHSGRRLCGAFSFIYLIGTSKSPTLRSNTSFVRGSVHVYRTPE